MAEFSKSKIELPPTLLYNNSAAVLCTNTPIYPSICAHLAADYDIYKEITNVIQANIKVKPQWVKAHQDQTTQLEDQTLDARLNIQADANVTTFRHDPPDHIQPTDTPTIFPTMNATLIINETYVTANLQQLIRDNSASSNMPRYIMHHTGWTT